MADGVAVGVDSLVSMNMWGLTPGRRTSSRHWRVASPVLRRHIDKDGNRRQVKIEIESIEWWSPALPEGQEVSLIDLIFQALMMANFDYG